MNESPPRLLTSATAIERLGTLCLALDDAEQVRLHFEDGTELVGVVATRPTLQDFRDADGHEGCNALLRLEPLAGEGPPRYVWLDGLQQVVRLGSA